MITTLTEEQQRLRAGRLTASMVAPLMSGDRKRILDMWLELTGDPDYKRVDLSHIWPVRLGSVTEQAHLDWLDYKGIAKVTRRGEVVIGNPDWMACTLDGWDETRDCPIECKHCGGREPISVLINRYMPQMIWQMLVTKRQRCVFSVIMGAKEPTISIIDYNEPYATELMRRAEQFMAHVKNLTRPV